MKFADGQRRTCRLQIFSLLSANETFAIGKCLAGRRQNSYRINGKFFICHREIFCRRYISNCTPSLQQYRLPQCPKPAVLGYVLNCVSKPQVCIWNKKGKRPVKCKTPYSELQRKQAVRTNAADTPQEPAKKTSRARSANASAPGALSEHIEKKCDL